MAGVTLTALAGMAPEREGGGAVATSAEGLAQPPTDIKIESATTNSGFDGLLHGFKVKCLLRTTGL
ncbi:MAG: hypothetical protein A2147_08810 [Chloroflexi bacterium RBG_16_57_8]|nr:MAG: hypothetical protein A2147_08810 [Chloroflexi bacterium RBG_16_57_8]